MPLFGRKKKGSASSPPSSTSSPSSNSNFSNGNLQSKENTSNPIKRKSDEMSGNQENEDPQNRVYEANRKKARHILLEFDDEVQTRIQQLEQRSNNCITKLENSLDSILASLPPAVKCMTLKDFLTKQNDSITASARKDVNNYLLRSGMSKPRSGVPFTPLSSHVVPFNIAPTPSSTVSRVRIAQSEKKNKKKDEPAQLMVKIDGVEVDVSTEEGKAKMMKSKQTKQDALKQLALIQQQVTALVNAVQD